MTYEIRDINQLEGSTQELANTNQKVTSDVSSLEYILKEIRENWQNDEGTDIMSIVAELEQCINKLRVAITPTVGRYVDTMNSLVAESRATQNKSM